ncbi:feruloyl-CoA synthase [Cupriavidus sp. CV2]|uniref:feruloyl-CoA synthase n=1 Tax=Cupriavidus ulmosensis TaxID=3065913 RepID=UPI00296AF425|nr:feruloyl-CoA synthase [Cupriavidus sp. CV2]MDW3683033.1 feruloyl-CoA synthase [Cupriavidus sp. CV2]
MNAIASTIQESAPRYRTVAVSTATAICHKDGDVWRITSAEALADYPSRMTDCLTAGAERHPDRVLVAQRGAQGNWIEITYREMLARARAIGQALLDRGLCAQRPLAILSGNDLEHLQLSLGAMWAGIPFSSVSPPYSLVSTDYGKLRHVFEVLTPGLVYAADGAMFARAIGAVVPADMEVVTRDGSLPGRTATAFDALVQTQLINVDDAQAAVGPETLVKFLFTSGSTRQPKAVPTTHRMLCSNQQMLRQAIPDFTIEPPVLVDWLPWNHTFGSSHNFGIVLYNGGTLYIDDGKPAPGKFEETLRNLREISPTAYFNVPKGWEELGLALERDAALRERFFSRVRIYFFGGAGLSQQAWDRLERVTQAHCAERIRIMAGLGMTETSPCCLFTTVPIMRAGYVGTPAPGCEVKLVPVNGKLEARFRGPHVMKGYWRMAETPAQPVFDEEGFYCSGDALKFVDAEQPELGFMFDGRIAEDFKLSSGTFVSVGPLRARVLAAGAPYVQDVAIAGMDRDDIGLLVFPRMEDCRRLSGLAPSASHREVLAAPAVRSAFSQMLTILNESATGSASRVARLLLLDEPPSLDRGEMTDKGTLNQRAVLTHRAALVDALYGTASENVITI